MKLPDSSWTFLSNHSHVLICLARDPGQRMRDVAEQVGITERAVQRIVRELIDAGVLRAEKEGRRNHYTIRRGIALRHPLESHRSVGHLLDAVLTDQAAATP
jgi:predicted transcriptional regulator